MAATLPGLPAELLLKIAESSGYYDERQQFESLRATSKKINEKITRIYGQKWYKDPCVHLNEKGLTRLVTISCGQLAFHVQSVTISCSTLLDHCNINNSSESSGTSDDPWYEDMRDSGEGYITRITFSEVIFEMLMNGHAAELLGTALARFPNLKRLKVISPYAREGIKKSMLGKLQWRWTLAVKAILSITLSRAAPQHALTFGHHEYPMPMNASILEHWSIYANKLRDLTTFDINLTTTDCEYENEDYARIMWRVMNNASCLTHLDIGFGHGDKNSELFKRLSMLEPKLKLQRLQIRQLRTRKRYLKKFLRPTKFTLEALVLNHVSIEAGADVVDFLQAEMSLKEVTLRYLNAGESGLHFDRIALQRPECWNTFHLDDAGWVYVVKSSSPYHEIELKQEEGDDIDYWLSEISEEVTYEQPWPWEYDA